MKPNKTPRKHAAFASSSRQMKRRPKVKSLLAVLVAFCTVCALTMPAATLEGQAQASCGLAEHTHDESCYESVLVCGQEEGEGHVHDESCYEEVLTCEIPEHTHSEACWAQPETQAEAGNEENSEAVTGDGAGSDMEAAAGTETGTDTEAGTGTGTGTDSSENGDAAEAGSETDSSGNAGTGAGDNGSAESGAESGDGQTGNGGAGSEADGTAENGSGTENAGEQGESTSAEDALTEADKTEQAENPQAAEEAAEMPDGATVPEGYTEQYTVRDEENGFAVTVYAPEGVVPEGAVLSAELLGEETEEYAAAEQELAAETEAVMAENGVSALSEDGADAASEDGEAAAPSYGFAALDIHFEYENGEEVEPNGDVYVVIDAAGLLPEDADPESVTVQHHAEQEDGSVTVETVADTTEETAGVVAVVENADEAEAKADVQAAFEVDGFSTFTITWASDSTETLQVYYGQMIDGNVEELDVAQSSDYFEFSSSNTIATFQAPEVPGYSYTGTAYVVSQGRWPWSSRTQAQIYDLRYQSSFISRDWQYNTNVNGSNRGWTDVNDNDKIYFIYQKNAEAGETIDTVDTIKQGVSISLYDYGKGINGSSSLPAFTDRFAFAGDGIGFNTGTDNGISWWNRWTNSGGGVTQGIVKNQLTTDGYPQLSSGITYPSGHSSLGYLFGAGGDSNVEAYEDLNYLFKYDEDTGYYTYDSSQNFATIYQPNGERVEDSKFLVYKDANTGQSSGSSGHPYFLPFNQPGTNESDGNYHFGMKITIDDFLMPKDGQVNDEDMIFSFSGDDDVWVYIDGVLILDMGGIHNSNDGRINFGEGTVTVDKVYTDGGESKNNRQEILYIGDLLHEAKSGDSAWISLNLERRIVDGETHWYLKDYTTHDLSFFYLERGAVDSNCKIEFNLYTLQPNTLTVGKEVSASTETSGEIQEWLGSLEYSFRVLKANAEPNTENPEDLFILTGTTFDIYDRNDQDTGKDGTVGADGVFTLKAGEYARFSNIMENSGEYFVQELIEKEYSQQFGNVVVNVGNAGGSSFQEGLGYENFAGVISNNMQASGVGYIHFNNKVDTENLSMLTITKAAREGSVFDSEQSFRVYVTIDGEPVKGTFDGVTFTDGIAEFKVGTTVSIPVLSGAKFTVLEENGDTYHIEYSAVQSFGDGEKYTYNLTSGSDGVSGEVGDIDGTDFGSDQKPTDATNATMSVTLTNSSYDFNVKLPVFKTLDGWNEGDEERTFSFNVVETDENGVEKASATEGISLVNADIEIGDTASNNGTVYINFKNIVEVKNYYFKISEDISSLLPGVTYDGSYYLATVTVSEAGGVKTASVKSIEKYNTDGTKDTTFNWESEGALAFTNSVGMDVNVKKVDDSNPSKGLSGAKFKLYYTEAGIKYYYSVNDNVVSWVKEDEADEENITLISDENGAFTIHRLPVGRTYYLIETEAPEGYQLLEHEIEISWNTAGDLTAYYSTESSDITQNLVDTDGTIVVPNRTGEELPETGGPGTTILTIGGLLLMAGAVGGGYGLRRRRGKEGR